MDEDHAEDTIRTPLIGPPISSIKGLCETTLPHLDMASRSGTSPEAAALKNTRKQRRYITKLRNVSKKHIFSDSGKAQVPTSQQPDETVVLKAKEEITNQLPNQIDDITRNKEKQTRYYNKLKSLVQQQLEKDETTNANMSSTKLQYVIRERSDNPKSIPKNNKTNVLKSIQDKASANIFSFFQCCTSMENYVEDVFSTDDDIDQLLQRPEDSDDTIVDEWSAASSPLKKSLPGEEMDGATTLDGSSKRERSFGSVLFRGDPCEI